MTLRHEQPRFTRAETTAEARHEDASPLPPEFADQIAEARFVEAAARLGLDDARFVEDGEFFDLVGFCAARAHDEAPAALPVNTPSPSSSKLNGWS